MGAVADFYSVPADREPRILARITAVGILVEDEGDDVGFHWYACRRGQRRVWLGFSRAEPRAEVCVTCPARRLWFHPIAIWRLLRDVGRAVQEANGLRH